MNLTKNASYNAFFASIIIKINGQRKKIKKLKIDPKERQEIAEIFTHGECFQILSCIFNNPISEKFTKVDRMRQS